MLTIKRFPLAAALIALPLLLMSCGGGGSGSGVASPPPGTTPPDTPPAWHSFLVEPTDSQPLAAQPISLPDNPDNQYIQALAHTQIPSLQTLRDAVNSNPETPNLLVVADFFNSPQQHQNFQDPENGYGYQSFSAVAAALDNQLRSSAAQLGSVIAHPCRISADALSVDLFSSCLQQPLSSVSLFPSVALFPHFPELINFLLEYPTEMPPNEPPPNELIPFLPTERPLALFDPLTLFPAPTDNSLLILPTGSPTNCSSGFQTDAVLCGSFTQTLSDAVFRPVLFVTGAQANGDLHNNAIPCSTAITFCIAAPHQITETFNSELVVFESTKAAAAATAAAATLIRSLHPSLSPLLTRNLLLNCATNADNPSPSIGYGNLSLACLFNNNNPISLNNLPLTTPPPITPLYDPYRESIAITYRPLPVVNPTSHPLSIDTQVPSFPIFRSAAVAAVAIEQPKIGILAVMDDFSAYGSDAFHHESSHGYNVRVAAAEALGPLLHTDANPNGIVQIKECDVFGESHDISGSLISVASYAYCGSGDPGSGVEKPLVVNLSAGPVTIVEPLSFARFLPSDPNILWIYSAGNDGEIDDAQFDDQGDPIDDRPCQNNLPKDADDPTPQPITWCGINNPLVQEAVSLGNVLFVTGFCSTDDPTIDRCTTQGDKHAGSSACGDVALPACLAAPYQYQYGSNIRGDFVQGTSFSAPIVAAAASIVRVLWPILSAKQTAEILLGCADNHNNPEPLLGHGALNLSCLLQPGDASLLVSSLPATTAPGIPPPPPLVPASYTPFAQRPTSPHPHLTPDLLIPSLPTFRTAISSSPLPNTPTSLVIADDFSDDDNFDDQIGTEIYETVPLQAEIAKSPGDIVETAAALALGQHLHTSNNRGRVQIQPCHIRSPIAFVSYLNTSSDLSYGDLFDPAAFQKCINSAPIPDVITAPHLLPILKGRTLPVAPQHLLPAGNSLLVASTGGSYFFANDRPYIECSSPSDTPPFCGDDDAIVALRDSSHVLLVRPYFPDNARRNTLNDFNSCGDAADFCISAPGTIPLDFTDPSATFIPLDSAAAAYVASFAALVRSVWPQLSSPQALQVILQCGSNYIDASNKDAFTPSPDDGYGALTPSCLLTPSNSLVSSPPNIIFPAAAAAASNSPSFYAHELQNGSIITPASFSIPPLVFYDSFGRDFSFHVAQTSNAPQHLLPFADPRRLLPSHNGPSILPHHAPALSFSSSLGPCSLAASLSYEHNSFAGAQGSLNHQIGNTFTPTLAASCSFHTPRFSLSLHAAHSRPRMNADANSLVSHMNAQQSSVGLSLSSSFGPLLLSALFQSSSGLHGNAVIAQQHLPINPISSSHTSLNLSIPF